MNPLVLYSFIFAVWSAYRFLLHFPDWIDEIVVKPIIQLAPVLFVVFSLEKKNWTSLGLGKNHYIRNVFIGVGLGIALVGERLVIQKFTRGFPDINSGNLPFSGLLLAAITSGATGFIEEIVFRGYFFQRLLWTTRNEFLANPVSSLLFTFIHLPLAVFILHYSQTDIFYYLMQTFILGAVFAYAFARTGSIVPSITAHAIWNFSNVLFK